MRAVIDQEGRVALPAEVLGVSGFKPGTEVEVEAEAGEVSIKSAEVETKLIQHNGRWVVDGTWIGSKEDAINLVDKMREERDHNIAGV